MRWDEMRWTKNATNDKCLACTAVSNSKRWFHTDGEEIISAATAATTTAGVDVRISNRSGVSLSSCSQPFYSSVSRRCNSMESIGIVWDELIFFVALNFDCSSFVRGHRPMIRSLIYFWIGAHYYYYYCVYICRDEMVYNFATAQMLKFFFFLKVVVAPIVPTISSYVAHNTRKTLTVFG